jgi:hypothetical protein
MQNEGGYIALTSVIIISLLLITIITALSSVNYFSRYNILENEFKERSSGLAEACVDYSLAKLAANSTYSGGETANIGTDSCRVVSVTSGGNSYSILTQGIFPAIGTQRSYTNLSVVVDLGLNITNWQEVP